MKSDWYPASETMGGYRCIKHRVTRELCLSGPNGEIWINSEGPEAKYACFTSSGKTCARLSRLLGVNMNIYDGSEARFIFSESQLDLVVAILSIYKTRPIQVKKARLRSSKKSKPLLLKKEGKTPPKLFTSNLDARSALA